MFSRTIRVTGAQLSEVIPIQHTTAPKSGAQPNFSKFTGGATSRPTEATNRTHTTKGKNERNKPKGHQHRQS